MDCGDVVDTHEDVAGEFLNGKVYFVLADPWYNVMYERNMNHFLHEVFTPEDMSKLVELRRQVLAAGAHGCVFCS